MRRILALAVAVLVAGCAGSTGSTTPDARAVVLVSGLASTSPFTTPDGACKKGLAAGSADTAIRDRLLSTGHTVYTAPMMAGRGPVHDQTGFDAFGSCPPPLPDDMTVDTSASIDLAGEHLARFLVYLHTDKGVNEVDLVGHSMGGLYARSAIRVLAETGSAHELGVDYLKGWNDFQAGALDSIPVTLIGGNHFARQGDPAVWPNDGIVALGSALAVGVDDAVLPHRRCYTFDATHSDYVSMIVNLPKETALTWDPRVLDAVNSAIDGTTADGPNRQDCPG